MSHVLVIGVSDDCPICGEPVIVPDVLIYSVLLKRHDGLCDSCALRVLRYAAQGLRAAPEST